MAAITTAGLRALQSQRVLEKTSLEVDVGEIPKYNGRNIPKIFEDIREYLTRLRGFTKIKLLYIICKTFIPPLSANDDETNYLDKDAEIIARVPILKRGTVAAANDAGLALQATNGPWDSNTLIYQRVVYVVMQFFFWNTPCIAIDCWPTPVEAWKCCVLDILQQAIWIKHGLQHGF